MRDARGSVVPAARVTLTATGMGIKAEAISDNDGNYLFAQLKPGRYSVSVLKEGFATSTVSNIDRQIGQRPRLDFMLKIGQTTERVEDSCRRDRPAQQPGELRDRQLGYVPHQADTYQ